MRAADLEFTLDETRELLAAAGIELSDDAVASLLSRTEGWAAGLRLAALSLAGRADPERFVAEFSGSERTVADYLFAEVLQRQTEPVRQLMLRTSILERVNGSLADRLLGTTGSERILLQLEDAGAFVFSIDPERSWFRYHQLFADLLRLELRRTEPDTVSGLHHAAAEWYADHGFADRRDPSCAGRGGLAVRRRSDRGVRLQPRARRQLRNDDRAAQGLSRRGVRQSGAGRLPGVWGSDPAVARHGRLVPRRGGAACVRGARRTPADLRRDARWPRGRPSPDGAAITARSSARWRPLLEPSEADSVIEIAVGE